MKKPKISLDSAKLKGLFVQHVEKLLLVLVVGMMLFLVYQGFSLPGLEQGKTPQGLLKTSTDMMAFIDDGQRWNQVKSEVKTNSNVAGDVVEDRKPVDASQYFLVNRWETPNFPKLSPRTDPKIFSPIHLVVVPQSGPLAYLKSSDDVDPLATVPTEEEEGAAPKPKAKPKAKPKKAKGDPMGMGLVGGDPMGMGMGEGGRKAKRGKGENLVAGGAPMGEGAADLGPLGGGMDGMGGMGMGMGMGGGGGVRGGINPESITGFQATEATAKNVQAVVVLAVVPFEKQFEEFQNSLANSLDYDSVRDSPLYAQYYVQRTDVTDDPSVDPASLPPEAWENIGVKAAKAETENWAGYIQEIVAADVVDRNLTHPAPPFMQRDLWDVLYHPDIPLAAVTVGPASGDASKTKRPAGAPKTTPADDAPTLDDVGPKRTGGSGFGEMAGMPGGGPTRGGAPVVGPRGGGGEPMVAGGMPGRGGGMPGMDGGGMGFGGGSGVPGAPPPKFKLIRFTDTTVAPGHKYRYHIRVLLLDPNHPSEGYTPPSPASLDSKVRDRIKLQDPKIWYVLSDWSEASPIAELPAANLFFAGSVKQPETAPVVAGKPEVPNTVVFGKALTVVWDPTKVVDVPAEVDVHRGSILNFVKDARVIHPVTHQVVDLAGFSFSTNAIVADMQGGQEIPLLEKQSKKPPLVAPGELLIFDASGNLHVQNETDDIDSFRRYLVPEAPKAAETTTGETLPAALETFLVERHRCLAGEVHLVDPLGRCADLPPESRPLSRPAEPALDRRATSLVEAR